MVDDEILRISSDLSIPRSELRFRFSRSSGPGGQHVQKSSTRVELLFDAAGSPSLTDEQRARVGERLSGYVDSERVLHLVAQSGRSQWRNREEAVERFQALMHKALKPHKRRRSTRPTAASREKRLRTKRQRAETKRLRGKVRGEP